MLIYLKKWTNFNQPLVFEKEMWIYLKKGTNQSQPLVFENRNVDKSQSSSLPKRAVSAILSHTKQQTPFQGTLDTQDHTSIDQPWSFNRPYRAPYMDLMSFEKKFRNFEKISEFSIFDNLKPL